MNFKNDDSVPDFIRYLSEQLLERTRENSTYSLRNFARDLNIDSSALSRILRGTQTPTLALASRLAHDLNLSDDIKSKFILSVGRVRVLELAAEISENLSPAQTTHYVLESIISDSPRAHFNPGIDENVYRSLIKILPGAAFVLDSVGTLIMKNDKLDGIDLNLKLSESKDWIDLAKRFGHLDLKLAARFETETSEVDFRFSPIYSSDQNLLGWLGTNFSFSISEYFGCDVSALRG